MSDPNQALDVTEAVQDRVHEEDGGSVLEISVEEDLVAWLGDPCPGKPKRLRIRYSAFEWDLETFRDASDAAFLDRGLRIRIPQETPPLRICSASWGHPTQPSGAYDVTPLLASRSFEAVPGGASFDHGDWSKRSQPARVSAEAGHSRDDPDARDDDDSADHDDGGSASATVPSAKCRSGFGDDPMGRWCSISGDEDLHATLGDPYRTLSKTLSIHYCLEEHRMTRVLREKNGFLLDSLVFRGPVVPPLVQVERATVQHALHPEEPLDVTARVRYRIEALGGASLELRTCESMVNALGLGPEFQPTRRPTETADASSSAFGPTTTPAGAVSTAPSLPPAPVDATSARRAALARFGLGSARMQSLRTTSSNPREATTVERLRASSPSRRSPAVASRGKPPADCTHALDMRLRVGGAPVRIQRQISHATEALDRPVRITTTAGLPSVQVCFAEIGNVDGRGRRVDLRESFRAAGLPLRHGWTLRLPAGTWWPGIFRRPDDKTGVNEIRLQLVTPAVKGHWEEVGIRPGPQNREFRLGWPPADERRRSQALVHALRPSWLQEEAQEA